MGKVSLYCEVWCDDAMQASIHVVAHSSLPNNVKPHVRLLPTVFEKIVSFTNKLKSTPEFQETQKLPKLYFASADIYHCFDKINQDHLFNLVKKILVEDDYIVQKYAICHPYDSLQRIQTKHVKKVIPQASFRSFREVAAELANSYTESIFVDGITCSILHKKQVKVMDYFDAALTHAAFFVFVLFAHHYYSNSSNTTTTTIVCFSRPV